MQSVENSESLYRTLVKFAADAIVIGDSAGRIVAANDCAAQLSGYAIDELQGMYVRQFFSEEELARTPLRFDLLLAGESVLTERMLICRDGGSVPVETHAKLLPNGNWHVFFRDIRGRHAAQIEREREVAVNHAVAELYHPVATPGTPISQIAELVLKHARGVTGSRHGFVSTIDPQSGDNVSHTLTAMMEGHCKVDPPGSIVFPRRPDGSYSGLWGEALNTKKAFYVNRPDTHPSSCGVPAGHVPLERFLAVPVLLGEEPAGLIALANPHQDYDDRDLEAIERLSRLFALAVQKCRNEEALIRAREAAEAANRSKSDFLANMSHELRTPLSGIIGMVSLLKQTALSEQQLLYLSSIDASSENLLGLVNDILDLSRIDARRIAFVNEVFSPAGIVRAIVAAESPALERKGLLLNLLLADDLPPQLLGDPLRFRQICSNLLNNAVKFTDAGTIEIKLAVVSRAEGKVSIGFQVHDTGIGMSPEVLQRIFLPFEQGDSALALRRGGSGLGLAICRQLVGLMGGEIQVESRSGVGSTFRVVFPFLLPAGSAAAVEKGARTPATRTPLPPLAILLAEDNMVNTLYLSDLLEGGGHTVDCASDGQQAFALWQAGRYDLVLMDVQMPVVDGIAAVGMIRAHESEGARTPILALTAYALSGDRDRFLSAGFDGYLSKPFTSDTLYTAMVNLIKPQPNDPE